MLDRQDRGNVVTKVLLLGFLIGALSVATFFQGTMFLLYHGANAIPAVAAIFGKLASPGWNLSHLMVNPPVPGLVIPSFVNQMFWGGLWGIVIAAMMRFTHFPQLFGGFMIGAIGCVGVAVTVVAALKGQPLFAGGNTRALLRAALINGAFGWGTVLMLRSLGMRR
jgi:hypothetical protein